MSQLRNLAVQKWNKIPELKWEPWFKKAVLVKVSCDRRTQSWGTDETGLAGTEHNLGQGFELKTNGRSECDEVAHTEGCAARCCKAETKAYMSTRAVHLIRQAHFSLIVFTYTEIHLCFKSICFWFSFSLLVPQLSPKNHPGVSGHSLGY